MGTVGSDSPKSSGEGDGIVKSFEEPKISESVVISNHQVRPETGIVPGCRSENGELVTTNGEAHEDKCEKSLTTLPVNSVKDTDGTLGDEILSPLQEDVQGLKFLVNHSKSCQSLEDVEHAEAETISKSPDSGDCVHSMGTSTAATLNGESAGTVGGNSELHIDVTGAFNVEQNKNQLASEENSDTSLKVVSAELGKDADSPKSLIATNTWHPLDSNEIALSPKAGEASLRNNEFDQASEALESFANPGTSGVLSSIDFHDHQLLSGETDTAVIISTDLDGWHRFDVEASESDVVSGFKLSVDGASEKRLELWEQLLEDGLERSPQCIPAPNAPVEESEVAIESSSHDGNQHLLASPGNPFIEGLDRLSNFSDADGFATNVNSLGVQSLHGYEADSLLVSNKGLIQSSEISKEKFPGTARGNDKSVEQNLGSQLNVASDGSKRIAQQRFPSFSDIRRSSSRPRDPSSLSFKKQELPYQTSNHTNEYEAGAEKWEANFDLMVPALHEAPRSLSLPREAGDSYRQGNLPVFSSEAPVASQSKPPGFLSPKLSPMVKKVVSKVCTAPDQVLNAVRQGKDPKAQDKRESRKWAWTSCICCSRGS